MEAWPPNKPGMGVHKPAVGASAYHEPSGVGVIATSESSHLRNKARALELLSRLLAETGHPK